MKLPPPPNLKPFKGAKSSEPGDVICSWSGGKDSALAFHRATQQGRRPKLMLTMMIEDGTRSRSHGLSPEVLEAQAAALGVPLLSRPTSRDDYEKNFRQMLRRARKRGVDTVLFGDIDVVEHREWNERVSSAEGLAAWLPLWQTEREPLLAELIAAGFTAEIVAVKDGKLPTHLLGRPVDKLMVAEIKQYKVDLAGEQGEYHTVVTNGPGFARKLRVDHFGPVFKDGYWFSEVQLVPEPLRYKRKTVAT